MLALRDAGYRVTVIDDLSSGRRDLVPGDVPLVRADIGDGRALRSILKEHAIGAVVHLAARVGVAESLSEPGEHHRVNDVATAELVGAAVDCGVRNVVFSSTAAVYGMPRAVPVGEDAPLTPFTPYGVSKAAAEGALRDAANGHDMGIIRLTSHDPYQADRRLRGRTSRTRIVGLGGFTAENIARATCSGVASIFGRGFGGRPRDRTVGEVFIVGRGSVMCSSWIPPRLGAFLRWAFVPCPSSSPRGRDAAARQTRSPCRSRGA